MIGIDGHVSFLPKKKKKKKNALCSLPEDVQEPPIIHWTALHPVPLPQ